MSQINVNTIALANGTEQARLVQVVNTETGAVATGTTVIPFDDTIPQITEGDEYMTLAITPTNSSNKLLIQVIANDAPSTTNYESIALFQDTTAGALAAGQYTTTQTGNTPHQMVLNHYMTAGTTSSTTFRVRIGQSASGTTTFNGASAGRFFGGVMASSITISEIRV